jgi:hypothetical protein
MERYYTPLLPQRWCTVVGLWFYPVYNRIATWMSKWLTHWWLCWPGRILMTGDWRRRKHTLAVWDLVCTVPRWRTRSWYCATETTSAWVSVWYWLTIMNCLRLILPESVPMNLYLCKIILESYDIELWLCYSLLVIFIHMLTWCDICRLLLSCKM